MFQLFKQRDFSSYINDTILFFKIYRQNYFKNYIIITGGVLAILCFFFFFIFRDLFGSLFSTINKGVTYDISYYFTDNPVLFVFILVGTLLLTISFSMFTIAYPVVYLKLTEETGRTDLNASEIFGRMKKFLPKIIRFTLFSILLFSPIYLFTFLMADLLLFLVLGFLVLLVLMPVIFVWSMQTLYIYLLNEISFINAMKQAWKILFSKKFWHIIGSTVVVYFVLSVIQGMITVIPYIVVLISLLVAGKGKLDSDIGVFISVFYIVSIVLSYILSNFYLVNQGIIYYSTQEQMSHKQALSEIDLIGQNVE